MQSDFFGRSEHLAILKKRIKDLREGYRQNVALIGDEAVGKSSLIGQLLRDLYDASIVTLYLETRPETPAGFCRRFIGVLLYNFLRNSSQPLREDIDFLMRKSLTYAPITVERAQALLKSLDKQKNANVFSQLLSLCDVFYSETGKRCVVIFDEFQRLELLGFKAMYKEWAKLLMVQKNTLYILVSSATWKARSIFSKDLQLLFGNFEVLHLEPFDIPTSEQFLSSRLQGIPLSSSSRNFLVHFTGGNPFYLDVIAQAIARSGASAIAAVLEELLFSTAGVLNQRFSHALARLNGLHHSNECVSLLYAIAQGHTKVRDLAHQLHRTKAEVFSLAQQMLETDIVVRSGDFLQMNDRVFSYWLRFVYQQKLQSFTFDAAHQKELFHRKIEELIREFVVHDDMPLGQRLVELVNLFQDDTVQIEKKKMRLERFREVKNVRFEGASALREGILCRAADSVWLLAVKDSLVTEEDVNDFVRECKKHRNKQQRRIIIALRDVEVNARLRAMEEKVFTWGLGHLNQLCDLYSRPRVIA